MSHFQSGVEPMAQGILDFWFGPLTATGGVDASKQNLWFAKDPEFDSRIRKRYEEDAHLAMMGAFDRWTHSPLGTVALVVLLDQFPRNMHRDSERAFAYDKKALATAWLAMDAGVHLQVPTARGYFVVMPTMHAELLDVQERGVAAFGELLRRADPQQHPLMQRALDYARRHHAVIAKFGRFPHRNRLLGRENTPAETAFLKEPGSSF